MDYLFIYYRNENYNIFSKQKDILSKKYKKFKQLTDSKYIDVYINDKNSNDNTYFKSKDSFVLCDYNFIDFKTKYPCSSKEKVAESISKIRSEETDLFFKNLNGEFNIITFKNNSIVCSSDLICSKPSYYLVNDSYFLISNYYYLLIDFLGLNQRIDSNWEAEFLSNQFIGNHLSPYKNIHKLPPASILKIDRQNVKLDISKNFSSISENTIVNNMDDAIEGLNYYLSNAIKKRVSSHNKIGLELSGGIDSSLVLKNLMSVEEKELLYTYSHIEPEDNFSFIENKELTKHDVNSIIRDKNLSNNHFTSLGNFDLISSIEEMVKKIKSPLPVFFPFLSQNVYNACRHNNIELLFSGYGGDEYISSHIKNRYQYLLQKNKYKKLIHELRYDPNRKHYLLISLISNILKFNKTNYTSPQTINKSLEYLKFLPLKADTNLYRKIIEKTKQKFQIVNDESKELIKLPNASFLKRIEYSQIISSQFNLNYSYPLLDKDLLSFFTYIPQYFLFNDGYGRYMSRKILEDHFPKEIVWRRRKSGTTIPWFHGVYNKNKENIKTFLNSLSHNDNDIDNIDLDKLKKMHQNILDSKITPYANPSLMLQYISYIIFKKNI